MGSENKLSRYESESTQEYCYYYRESWSFMNEGRQADSRYSTGYSTSLRVNRVEPACSPDTNYTCWSELQKTHILMKSTAEWTLLRWQWDENLFSKPRSPNLSSFQHLDTLKSSQSLFSVKCLLSHFPPAHHLPASAPLCSLNSGLNFISPALNN